MRLGHVLVAPVALHAAQAVGHLSKVTSMNHRISIALIALLGAIVGGPKKHMCPKGSPDQGKLILSSACLISPRKQDR